MQNRQPRMMIFVPMSREQARTVRADGDSEDDLDAFAATGQMITAHGYAPTEREDADYAALWYASVAGLPETDGYTRLVLAAEVPISRIRDNDSDSDYGAVRVSGLRWDDVAAVFVDEAASASAVQAARQAIAGADGLDGADGAALAAALQLPEVITLGDDHDLLWHHPAEDW